MSLSLISPLKLFTNGFASFEDEQTTPAIKQNLKMLLLTRPGEYPMDPDFGVGMSNYLFSHNSSSFQSAVQSRIKQQATKYMPYIRILNIGFDVSNLENNSVGITIEFQVLQEVLPVVFNLTVTI